MEVKKKEKKIRKEERKSEKPSSPDKAWICQSTLTMGFEQTPRIAG